MVILEPFTLFGRLLVAAFKITGYVTAYGLQILWHVAARDPGRIGDAIGELGARVTDATAEVFAVRR